MVPGWRGVDAPVPEALCAALASAYARGCRIISICPGCSFSPPPASSMAPGDNPHALPRRAAVPLLPQIQVVEDVLYVGDLC